MDQLEKIKMQNQSLRNQLSTLRNTHELILLELSQARQNQQKYKKLNDALVLNIENNKIDLDKMKNIDLIINGSFGCTNCAALEAELDQYRTGVNQSVQRRVKEIARNMSQFDDQSHNAKSRMSNGNKNNFFINFSKKKQECQHCVHSSSLLDKSNSAIETANVQIQQRDKQINNLERKLNNFQSLVQNLKTQNQSLQFQIQRLYEQLQESNSYQIQQNQHGWNSPQYRNQQQFMSPGSSFSKVGKNNVSGDGRKQAQMMKQITNIISCLSNKTEQGRGKTKSSNLRDSSALFSIKNGINRPQKYYY